MISNPTGPTRMEAAWRQALRWLLSPPTNPETRARQCLAINRVLVDLRFLANLELLHQAYASHSTKTMHVAHVRELFPDDWYKLNVHTCVAAAYGLRYAEMMTGHHLDPRTPPRWLGEWSA